MPPFTHLRSTVVLPAVVVALAAAVAGCAGNEQSREDFCEEQLAAVSAPTDRAIQPAYEGPNAGPLADQDGDGVVDWLDADPDAGFLRQPRTTRELEFNNNIVQANPLVGSLPLGIDGTLANGANYQLDTDYFSLDGIEGQRITVLLFKGQRGDDGIELDRAAPFTPRVAVLSATGRRLDGTSPAMPDGVTAISVAFPSDGTYYVEISDPRIEEAEYSYTYTAWLDADADFDGLFDGIEAAVGSDPERADSDGDGLTDLQELLWFVDGLDGYVEPGSSLDDAWDPDGDGIPAAADTDSDGDGIPDRLEGLGDADGDGVPNRLDTDANGNGIPDGKEVGESFAAPADQDKDGVPDFLDMDTDGDGVPNFLDELARPAGEQCSRYVPDAAADMFAEDGLAVEWAVALDDGERLAGVALAGRKLEILGRGFGPETRFVFPTAISHAAVAPVTIPSSPTLVTVTVPANAVGGAILAYAEGRRSNAYDLQVVDPDADPYLLRHDGTDVGAGTTLTLAGGNLGSDPVRVRFTSASTTTWTTATPFGGGVTLSVPADAPAGTVAVELPDGRRTNALDLQVTRTLNVSIAVPEAAEPGTGGFRVLIRGESFATDARSGSLSVPVDNHGVEYLGVLAGPADNPYVVHEALVLPGDVSATLTPESTVVKALFFALGYPYSQPASHWTEIREILRGLSQTELAAAALAEAHESDPRAYHNFDDRELNRRFTDALEAAAPAVAERFEPAALAPVQPEIDPEPPVADLYLKPVNVADMLLQNDNKVYISARAVGPDGKEIRSHIRHMWDSKIIGPQGWGLFLVSTDVELMLGGRDTKLEIQTAGSGEPVVAGTVHRHLVGRTVLDGVILPLFNEVVLAKLLGKKLQSEVAAKVLIDFIGPQNWNGMLGEIIANPGGTVGTIDKYVLKKIYDTLVNSCLQATPGDACVALITAIAQATGFDGKTLLKQILKRLGIEAATYLTPILSQLKSAWEIATKVNTFGSMVLTGTELAVLPGQVEFDIDYPLEVDSVFPACWVRSAPGSDDPKVIVEGKGFLPVASSSLFWWIKDQHPEVTLGGTGGEILLTSELGDRMVVQFDGDALSDGEQELKVTHQQQEAVGPEPVRVAADGVFIDRMEPTEGAIGTRVTIWGCGFDPVAANNDVFFETEDGGSVRATILSATTTRLVVVVPEGAVTGDVWVHAGSRVADPVLFTVEAASVTITYGDCGAANDDTFALYVDGSLASSMAAPARPFPVNVDLAEGPHEVAMVGITAPDDVGTYCIDFSSNVAVISGDATSGSDMTAGVRKRWFIDVGPGPGGAPAASPMLGAVLGGMGE